MKTFYTILLFLFASLTFGQECAPSYSINVPGSFISLNWLNPLDIPSPLDSIDYGGTWYSGTSSGSSWRNVPPESAGTFSDTILITIYQAGMGCNYVNGVLTGILPVELSYFGCELKRNTAYLRWITLSETNNNYFSLERSTDGFTFMQIMEVCGAGNSNYPIAYSTVDNLIDSDTYYYRLRQVDFNGKYRIYDSIAVTLNRDVEVDSVTNLLGQTVSRDHIGPKIVYIRGNKYLIK